MRAQHMWIITTLRRWTQRQHQIFWSWWFNIHQHLSKHAKINMSIRDHEFSHQRSRREESRRSKRDRRCSDDDAKRNVYFKKTSRLREHWWWWWCWYCYVIHISSWADLHHNNAATKEAHIMSCKICIADLMLHQFEKAVLTKEYAEMKQEEKKERKKAKLKNWYQQSRISFVYAY